MDVKLADNEHFIPAHPKLSFTWRILPLVRWVLLFYQKTKSPSHSTWTS
jgi:hypothetical protein